MKQLIATIVFTSIAASCLAEPSASRWVVSGSPSAPPFRLTVDMPAGMGTSGTLECRPDGVEVTETGVTKLDDISSGKIVADDGSAPTLPPGAATMALYLNQGKPHLRHATAHHNAVRGWDLTIELT